MIWHSSTQAIEAWMNYPRDGGTWKHFDASCPDFAYEPRNVHIGLCMDGFQTYSGPDSPGKDTDVYLRQLIHDLKSFWEVGVVTYNATKPYNLYRSSSTTFYRGHKRDIRQHERLDGYGCTRLKRLNNLLLNMCYSECNELMVDFYPKYTDVDRVTEVNKKLRDNIDNFIDYDDDEGEFEANDDDDDEVEFGAEDGDNE
ncbi:hypothetical protein LIER_43024 [Lithospermum erythrorhizon]|uniref:Uncharacterized protein n=1 Tax=Lithospermum erythrorhizon TaxID=34254 RepID=A0AAV3PB94_LITER